MKIPPKEKCEVILTYNSIEHKLGEVRESVRFYSDDPKTGALSIHITGYIAEKPNPSVKIFPLSINLNLASNSEEGAIGKFSMQNQGDESIKITSIKPSADYLAPLRSELNLNPGTKEDLQVVLLQDKAVEQMNEEGAEEYLYFTIALLIKIDKSQINI